MRRLFAPGLVVLLTLVSGCARDEAGEPVASAPAFSSSDAATEGAGADAARSEVAPASALGSPAAAPAPAARTLRIKSGTVTLETNDVTGARKGLATLATRAGGYVGDETEARSDEYRALTITLRVPAARFDTLLDTLDSFGEVRERAVTVQDVTASYVDTEARLRTRLGVEERYRALLARANKVEDILRLEEALRAIREEIESAQGQLRLYDNQIALSTLTVTLRTRDVPPDAPRAGFAARLRDAFGDGIDFFEGLLLLLVRLWPFALLVPLGVFGWRRFVRWRKARRDAEDAGPTRPPGDAPPIRPR